MSPARAALARRPNRAAAGSGHVAPLACRVLGTGAMACWLGGLLGRVAGVQVTLVGRWPEALERLAAPGLEWRGPRRRWRVPLGTHARHAVDLPPADIVVVLVKAGQTAGVAPLAFRRLAPGACVVSLQNGLGARTTLLAARRRSPHPRVPVLAGVATVGARLLGPGVVRVSGTGQLALQRPTRATTAWRRWLETLRHAGVELQVVDDVRPLQWRKLVANCAINALGALHGVPNGRLLEPGPWSATFAAAAREAAAVAVRLGLDLGTDPLAWASAVARATAGNRSSMLQDLERGVPTEIQAMHGAVIRLGRRLGVPTPALARLYAEVRERERALGAAARTAGRRRPAQVRVLEEPA